MRRQTTAITLGASLLAGIAFFLVLWPVHAQAPTPQISVDSVDTSQFPTVVVELTVPGALNASGSELTAADFQIFEDGRKVPTGSIVLEQSDSQPIGFVFLVDVSTQPADLEEIKSGLKAFLAQMRPGDQGILLTFGEVVNEVQPLTQNRDELISAVDRMVVGGSYTALNRSTVEALNRAALMTTVERKALIIVADSPDNNGSLPLSDVYSRADQLDFPIYLLAYGPKSQAGSGMQEFGLGVAGLPIITETSTAARLRLLSLGSLFDRGYRLQYLSSLLADSAEHAVSINLVGGQVRSVDGSNPAGTSISGGFALTALPRQVNVGLPGLSDSQTVGGLVELMPTINAPGPVRSVEYLIDGRSMGVVEQAPYGFSWDTGGFVDGSHVVEVRVVDSAGNTGATTVTVTVVDPLRVQATVDRSTIYVGDMVYISVDVQALAGVGAVDFLVNGVMLERQTEPPFLFQFDSEGYERGEQIVTIQASDRTGYMETTKFSMNLLPPLPRFVLSPQAWLRIFAVSAIVLALILSWLLLRYLDGAARRRLRRRFSLALDNMGNVVSSYVLRMDDPKGMLRFTLLHQGMKLTGRTVRDWVPLSQEEWENLQFRAQTIKTQQADVSYAAAQPVASGNGNGMSGGLGEARAKAGAGLGKAKAGAGTGLAKLKDAGEASTKVAGVAGAGASLLYALGGFLPASLGGAALRRAAQGSMGAYRGVRNVERVQRHAGQIQTATSGPNTPLAAAQLRDLERARAAGFGTEHMEELTGQTMPEAPEMPEVPEMPELPEAILPVPAADEPAPAPGTALAVQRSVGRPVRVNGNGHRRSIHSDLPPALDDVRFDAAGIPHKLVTRKIDDVWMESPKIDAGDSIFLELIIEPTHPRRRQSVPFRIISKSIEAEEKPLVIHEASVDIRGRSWLSWLVLPLLIISGTAVIVVFMLTFLLNDLGWANWGWIFA